MKRTLIYGAAVIPIAELLKHGWLLTDKDYTVVKPKYPHFLLEERGGLIPAMRLVVVHGPDLTPTPILEQLTKTGDRYAVMKAAKELAQNDDPVPLHTVDLIDLANRVAAGEINA